MPCEIIHNSKEFAVAECFTAEISPCWEIFPTAWTAPIAFH
jgi:hypothetical protein